MAVAHGSKGYITLASGAFVNVVGFEMEEATEPYEVTALAAVNPTSKAFLFDGLKEYSGTVNCQHDQTTQVLSVGGTKVQATFTTATGRTWVGDIGITRVRVVVDRNDAQTATYEFRGTGDWTKN